MMNLERFVRVDNEKICSVLERSLAPNLRKIFRIESLEWSLYDKRWLLKLVRKDSGSVKEADIVNEQGVAKED